MKMLKCCIPHSTILPQVWKHRSNSRHLRETTNGELVTYVVPTDSQPVLINSCSAAVTTIVRVFAENELGWVGFLVICSLYTIKIFRHFLTYFFLGWVWPWVGEFVGFIIIFTCIPTQQDLVNRKHPGTSEKSCYFARWPKAYCSDRKYKDRLEYDVNIKRGLCSRP